MIEFKEGREFIGVWFAFSPVADWMGAAWRDGEGPWQYAYRFRYYVDEKAHDSEDVKNWYKGEIGSSSSVETIITIFKKVTETLPLVEESHFLDMRGLDFEAQAQKLTAAPWSHVKTTAPGGEA